jgi:hypothetical protein
MKALKVIVLLLSVSVASVLVWNAARNQNPAKRGSKDTISPAEMQGSSKSKAIGQDLIDFEREEVVAHDLAPSSKSGGLIEPEDIQEIVESDKSASKVTDEEVKRTRDMMMSTSKSGRIMSDEKIREMLEQQKKEELEYKKDRKLMPSSKSIDAILKPKDVKEIIEGDESGSRQEPKLIPSSKNPIRLLEPKDVERIVEGGGSDFIKPQEPQLPPQEDPFAPAKEKDK